jgi:2'-5' RNA ligase
MARVRTFIAVDISSAVRHRAGQLQDALAQAGTEVKWVEAENLHVTLLFLGEVDDREIPAVCRVVSETLSEQPSFVMSMEKAGCFPHPRRPRILWIGVGEGAKELCAIHDALEPPLMDLGCYRREERRYTPHITIGRVRSDRPTDRLAAELASQSSWQGGQVEVREILVMGSELTSHGPVYSVLSRAKLKAS